MSKLVSLEIAKELKSQGYHKPCEFYYLDKDLPFCPKGLGQTKHGRKINHNRFDDFIYSAPTISEAFDYVVGTKIKYESSVTITFKTK